MDLTSIFTDDQLAIVGCFVALGLCGAVAALSFHLGPAGRQQRQEQSGVTHRMPQPETVSQPIEERRAA